MTRLKCDLFSLRVVEGTCATRGLKWHHGLQEWGYSLLVEGLITTEATEGVDSTVYHIISTTDGRGGLTKTESVGLFRIASNNR
jgi:hypothetical protein